LNKTDSAQITLTQLNPHIQIQPVCKKIDAQLLSELMPSSDVILDCTDNFPTRHLINTACVTHRKPLIFGAAIQFDGQCSVFDRRQPDSPCYACIFPPNLNFEETACATMGVFAPLVGVMGVMQAAEALKLLMQIGASLAGKLLLLDALTMQWRQISVRRNPQCAVCGSIRTKNKGQS
jgi:molybdopterin/thiamine biosynthesis adenylyltransferase